METALDDSEDSSWPWSARDDDDDDEGKDPSRLWMDSSPSWTFHNNNDPSGRRMVLDNDDEDPS